MTDTMSELSQEDKFRYRMRMELEDEAERGLLKTAPHDPAPVKASMGDVIAGTPIARLAMGAASPLIGAAQLGAHVGDAANTAMGVEPVVGPWIDQQLKSYEEAKQRGMQASGTEGTDVMGLIGQLAPSGAIAKGVGAALPAATSVLGRMGVGAAQGGAVAASTPVTNTDEGFWSPKGMQAAVGTAIGGAVPLATDTVKGLYGLGKKALEPIYEQGRAAILKRFQENILGNDPSRMQQVVQAAQQAKPLVPGSQPTLGEATADIPGATGLHAHQQSIAKLPSVSPQFAERAAEQEGARAGAIGQIAQTPSALETAVKARGAQAKQLYGAAGQLSVPAKDPTFKALMDRPSMQKAAARASELAQEAGETFNPTSVKSLHYMKMAMDDLLKNPERFSIGATEAGAMAKTQKEFVQWIGEHAPPYEEARSAFQKASGPINRMQIGQQLGTVLRNPLDTGERGAMFAKAVEESPRTIKKATGQAMFDKLDEVLQPGESQAVNKVAAELSRQDAFKRSAAKTGLGGADAIPGKVGLPLPNLLSRPAMIANFMMSKFGESAENKIAKVAAAQYLNPKQFAASMAEIPPRYRPMIEALMRQAGLAAATGAARNF